MLKCGLKQKERREVNIALGCYEQLWRTIHQVQYAPVREAQ